MRDWFRRAVANFGVWGLKYVCLFVCCNAFCLNFLREACRNLVRGTNFRVSFSRIQYHELFSFSGLRMCTTYWCDTKFLRVPRAVCTPISKLCMQCTGAACPYPSIRRFVRSFHLASGTAVFVANAIVSQLMFFSL